MSYVVLIFKLIIKAIFLSNLVFNLFNTIPIDKIVFVICFTSRHKKRILKLMSEKS